MPCDRLTIHERTPLDGHQQTALNTFAEFEMVQDKLEFVSVLCCAYSFDEVHGVVS